MIYHFGPYQLDVQGGELRAVRAVPSCLEPKVLDVLVYLLQHRDRIVTKEELLEHCWQGPCERSRPHPVPAKSARPRFRIRQNAGHPDALWPWLPLCGPRHGATTRPRPAAPACTHHHRVCHNAPPF